MDPDAINFTIEVPIRLDDANDVMNAFATSYGYSETVEVGQGMTQPNPISKEIFVSQCVENFVMNVLKAHMVKKEFELARNTAEQLAASRQLDAAQWFDARRIEAIRPSINSGDLIIDEDTAGDFVAVSVDPNSKPLSYSVSVQPLHGSVSVLDNVFTYTPSANYSGLDAFSIVASNDICSSENGIVSVVVNAVNDVLTVDSFTTNLDKNTTVDVELTGVDLDGETFDYVVVDSPVHGELSGTAPLLTYTPEADFVGVDSFTYKITNTAEESTLGTVTINVNEVVL
jgi:hypothetical protein